MKGAITVTVLQFLLGGGGSFSAGGPGECIGLDLGFSVLGFGGWANVKGAITVPVLQFLLEGGGSFPAGGPVSALALI